MLPDRVSNPGPLTYESGALPIALRGPALFLNNPRDLDLSYKTDLDFIIRHLDLWDCFGMKISVL